VKRIAAIITEYRPDSHAEVLVTKFLKGFPTDKGFFAPRVDVASFYIDQIADEDIGLQRAAEHGVPVYSSVVKALTLGTEDLAVDGVLLIGEHGNYAWNEKEQHLFPRRYFMEQVCGVMATSGRSVPVFNDKHLSYSWDNAMWMYNRAQELGAPFMAGSSLPVTWRSPWLEHESGTPIAEAVIIGFSGLDICGSHTLEALQCMVERRAGGETGVRAVTCLAGDAVWRAASAGQWSRELVEAACAAIEDKPGGSMVDHCENPVAFIVEYCDGLQATVLMLSGYASSWAYAARVATEERGESSSIVATEFFCQGLGAPGGAYGHFSYLGLNIEEMFLTGTPTYPVERTLLATGVLEAALDSRHEGYVRKETPWLDVTYDSYHDLPWRPTGPRPSGAALDPWPPGGYGEPVGKP